VRPAVLPVTTRFVVNLSGNGGSLKIDRNSFRASLLDGAFVSVGVSQSAAFDVPSLVMTLDRYLWLRRADDQPRHAAALCQRAGQERRPARGCRFA
jgi:hypothetical protein